MNTYTKFTLAPRERVKFNPENKEHVIIFAKFLKDNNWQSTCPFYLEDPYLDIPTMIRAKIADFVSLNLLKNQRKAS